MFGANSSFTWGVSRIAGNRDDNSSRTIRAWSRASLVANVVEYQPSGMNEWGIHKFISRIKAEEQIWNKVVDTIFGLDRLVRADKQLRHLGRFVKDVFGVKAIVGDPKASTMTMVWPLPVQPAACAWARP